MYNLSNSNLYYQKYKVNLYSNYKVRQYRGDKDQLAKFCRDRPEHLLGIEPTKPYS